jgi:hypothetical protein
MDEARNMASGNVEPKAEDRAEPVAERIYAPASERVPKEPVEGHRQVIENTDPGTPERAAAAQTNETEAPFARVSRPGEQRYSTDYTASGRVDEYADADWQGGRQKMFMGLGASWLAVIGGAVGVWLFMRWRAERERNKPINKLRRQALEAWLVAEAWRSRMSMPTYEEAARPAAGLGSALIPLLFFLWRQSRQQSREERIRAEILATAGRGERMGRQADKAARRAAQTMSEVDWQRALLDLKERWNPARLELEKYQISRR